MFKTAFLQHAAPGRVRDEEKLLSAEFARRGVPVVFYTAKRIQRRDLPLSSDTFIAGDMDAMHGAMRQLKIELPAPDDYPECLAPFMHRRVWRSTLGDVEQRISWGDGTPVFVKPAERRKSFTGRVFAFGSDFAQLGPVSRKQAVWCVEVVQWLSEFRVYVIDAQIVAIDLYAGDATHALDRATVDAALKTYRDSGCAPSAYGIDFGVLASGQTALVEANDGYALGAYEISAEAYTDLLVRRWAQLLDGRGE